MVGLVSADVAALRERRIWSHAAACVGDVVRAQCAASTRSRRHRSSLQPSPPATQHVLAKWCVTQQYLMPLKRTTHHGNVCFHVRQQPLFSKLSKITLPYKKSLYQTHVDIRI